jgi:hypothetical protein
MVLESENSKIRHKHLMDLREIAATFDVDENTIQLWRSEGMPKQARDMYDFVECALWKIKRLEHKVMVAQQSVDDELHQQKIMGEKLSNEQRWLKLQREAKQVVPVTLVRYAWLAEMKKISRAMKNVVNKILQAVDAANGDKLKLRESIEGLINEVKEKIASDLTLEPVDDDDDDDVIEDEVVAPEA